MKRILYASAALMLVACGYSEDAFEDDLGQAMCEWTVECYPDLYDDVDACLDDAEEMDDMECDYDSTAAKDCVTGTEEMTCPAEGEFPEFPSVCGDVFTNCDTGEAEE